MLLFKQPVFVFKAKGTRTTLPRPTGVKYNWAPKGLYHLQQMLYTILNLPNRFNIFTTKNCVIYVLDDHSLHIMPKIKLRICYHRQWSDWRYASQ